MKSSEVKSYTAILIALEGAAESVRNLLSEQADLLSQHVRSEVAYV